MDLQRAGARCIVLLADLHAYLNHKGTLEDIRMVAEYNKHCFIALGLDARRTEFLLGSSFQFDPDFIIDVLRMATETTLLRARRSMAEIARRADDPDVAQALYPIMQAVDMARLGVDVAVGGNDQRKVHMIAREKLPVLGHKKPVCVHVPLLHGTDGSAKMSSSKDNFIAVDDEPSVIKKKVMKAFCPPRQVVGNPIIEYAEHVVLPSQGKLEIKRQARYGGSFELTNAEELKKIYMAGELHPADLKMSVAEALVDVLAPVRKYLEKHSDTRSWSPNVV